MMEQLFALIVLWIVIGALSKSAKKKTNGQAAKPGRAVPPTVQQERQAVLGRQRQQANSAASHPQNEQKSHVSKPIAERHQQQSQGIGSSPCKHEDDIYAGSMNVDSLEGYDMEHDHGGDIAAEQTAILMPEQPDETIQMDFSDGDQLVRAFVMQQVLGRPKSLRQ